MIFDSIELTAGDFCRVTKYDIDAVVKITISLENYIRGDVITFFSGSKKYKIGFVNIAFHPKNIQKHYTKVDYPEYYL